MGKKAKEKKSNDTKTERAVKKSGAGAVIGSILFFLLTFLLAILLLCSTVAYETLSADGVSKAISQMDLSQAQWKENGKKQNMGQWVYEWYMQDAPNLTPEYAEAALANEEINGVICDYITDLSAYLTKKSDEMPEVQAETFADLMQDELAGTLEKETGVRFAETDRVAFLYATEDDVPAWNQAVDRIAGHGFGKFAVRFFCTLPGVVTAAVLTGVSFVLWLAFAIRKHWRKGRMLTASGVAVAVPGLLVLIADGLVFLLAGAMNVLDDLSFARDGLSDLLLPSLWSALIVALCGIIPASIGICINAVCRVKAKKQGQAAPFVPEAAEPQPEKVPVLAGATPENPAPAGEFVYSPVSEVESPEPNVPDSGVCPHCGAQNEPGSKFCGSCGQKM